MAEVEYEMVMDPIFGPRRVKKFKKEAEELGKDAGKKTGKGFKKGLKSSSKDVGKDLFDKIESSAKKAAKSILAIVTPLTVLGVAAVREAVKVENALLGLKSVAESTGASVGGIQQEAERLASDGLIPLADVSESLKNLLVTFNGDLETSVQVFKSFRTAAAFNRQATLSLGEAIKGASEGLKNDNSIKVDNTGITKNLSVIQKEYAASIGKTIGQLTEVEKRQAKANGIIKEAAIFQGDYNKLLNTFSGSTSKVAGTFRTLLNALGKIITESPAVIGFVNNLAEVLGSVAFAADEVRVSLQDVSKANADKKIKDISVEIIDLEQELFGLQKSLENVTDFEKLFTIKDVALTGAIDAANVKLKELKATRDSFFAKRDEGEFVGPPEPPKPPELDPAAKNKIAQQLGQIGLTQQQILIENQIKQDKIINDALNARIINEQMASERIIETRAQLEEQLNVANEETFGVVGEQASMQIEGLEALFSGGLISAQEFADKTAKIFDKFGDKSKKTGQTVFNASRALSSSISTVVEGAVTAIAKGQNAFEAISGLILGTIAGLAIDLGKTMVAAGIAIETLKFNPGLATTLAGVALIAVGSLIKASVGGGGGATSGAGGGGGFSPGPEFADTTEQADDEEREGPDTNVTVVVQGDNFNDAETSARRIVDLINDGNEKQNLVINGAAVGA